MSETSVLDMGNGEIRRKVDEGMAAVIENCLDWRTAAKAKRKVTLTLNVVPDEERGSVVIYADIDVKLAPIPGVVTQLGIVDQNGEICAVEMVRQIPGKTGFYGDVTEEEPIKLRIGGAK